MKRREFIWLLGGAAVSWPLAARAQQPAMPVIGLLDPRSPDAITDFLRAFRQGLKETGHIEGENLAIEYRWAENQVDRLPALATNLVQRRVALIVASATSSVLPAKAATATIPIVFLVNDDPVRPGLVASQPRPGGNLTGINWLANELTAKRMELLRELAPGVARIALLVTTSDEPLTAITVRDAQEAARAMGLQVKVHGANTSREIDAAFATFTRERPDALFVGPSAFFNARRVQLAHLATYHRIPSTFPGRNYVEAGGLMSYGADLTDAYRQMGVYTGRVLKGAKPADLPVVQVSKFELVINHQTARMLGLTVPPSLLATADEVIE